MKPKMMTSFGWPDGNCYAACVASLFEVEIADLPAGSCPPLQPGEDASAWVEPWQNWFKSKGLWMLAFDAMMPKPDGGEVQVPMKGLGILSCAVLGADPCADGLELRHAVVVCDGKIIHDPQGPGNTHRLWPREYQIFLALDPAKLSLAAGSEATHAS